MQDELKAFEQARGAPAPEKLWLIYMGSGDTAWSSSPPDDDEPCVTYALNTRTDPALAAAQAEVARWKTAAQEAMVLIDEINERKASRAHYGIEQGLHGKLCTIRATLARAALVTP